MQTLSPESGFRTPPNWPENLKNGNSVTIFPFFNHRQFFLRCFVSLVNCSYCSKFHVNIITSFGIMTNFSYKGFTRNLEIGKTPVWVLPNIWRLGRVMDTKFDTNVSNKMLLNTAKYQGYSYYSPHLRLRLIGTFKNRTSIIVDFFETCNDWNSQTFLQETLPQLFNRVLNMSLSSYFH